jgi:hypothetical protein
VEAVSSQRYSLSFLLHSIFVFCFFIIKQWLAQQAGPTYTGQPFILLRIVPLYWLRPTAQPKGPVFKQTLNQLCTNIFSKNIKYLKLPLLQHSNTCKAVRKCNIITTAALRSMPGQCYL